MEGDDQDRRDEENGQKVETLERDAVHVNKDEMCARKCAV